MTRPRVTDDALKALYAERARWYLGKGVGAKYEVGREVDGRKVVLFTCDEHKDGLKIMEREAMRAGVQAAISWGRR